jgi:hypothetical protein
MILDEVLAPLEQAWGALAAAVRALPEERFLAPLRGWSARDIVAHLIGWNRLMRRRPTTPTPPTATGT